MRTKWLGAGLVACLCCGSMAWLPARGQDRPGDSRGGEAKKDDGEGSARPSRPERRIRPYDRVITKEAKTSPGLFLVHRIEDKVFFEVPTSELGKEMLWVTQLEQTQTGYSHAGEPVGDRVVRWEQRGDDLLLRDVRYEIRADVEDPIQGAVKATSMEPIIAVLPIQAYGKDKRPVVEVTSIFTGDLPEFTARRRLGASGVDPRRTFIEKVKAFPTNIEAKILVTYRTGGGGGGMGGPGGPIPGGGGREGSVTVMLHHSLIDLPEKPMRPRRYDDRVGYFTVSFEDYGSLKHQVEEVRYITRWRLEKKDPKAAVSEPKKPIVFYLGREIPARYRPWIKKGIEAWQPAFEKAGFKNAILAKEPPTPQEDPDWDAEDARYSSIRWLPSTIENAYGPHVSDPRTGEILEADIRMYHNILKLVRDWYFVQASPNDPKAQSLPLSDELIGELLQYVTSHEVGHSLGFRHNMKASSSYTVEQLRNKEFTKKFGVEASIMDYGRFNYVAQPGDGARLIPIIGPYDDFAVEWGYREFPDAKTYDQEKKELAKITARQLEDRKLRFGDPDPAEDPSQQTEDLGSDPIQATEFGLKNIDRVAGFLVKATAKPNENYELLGEMYEQLLGQRRRELGHVVNLVGGFVRANLWYPEGKKIFDPIQAEQQKKAVKFLIENGLRMPPSLVAAEILDRLESHGTAGRILASQQVILRALVNKTRIDRMSEFEARSKDAYKPADLFGDLFEGMFSDLRLQPGKPIEVDLYRRNLQRAYVDLLASFLENPADDSDLPALARHSLQRVQKELPGGSLTLEDLSPTVRAHLTDLRTRAEHALDPIPSAPRPDRSPVVLPSRRRGATSPDQN